MIIVLIFALTLLLHPHQSHAAWVGPSVAPPGNNAPSPINVGANTQRKTGNLQLDGGLYFIRTIGGIPNLVAGSVAANIGGTHLGLLRPDNTWGLVVENATGNVGIGTPAPANPLTVIATNNVEGPPIPRVIAAGDPSAPTKTISIGYNTTADAGVLASVHAGTGWKNTLINPIGGNVGIGTAGPGERLDVSGKIRSSSGFVYNAGNGVQWWLTGTGNGPAIMLQQHSALGGSTNRRASLGWMDNVGAKSEFLTWSDAGNVGIGTASPGAKLDVAGSIKIVDGSQAAGRVLTSNATGLATWTTLTGTLPPGTSGQTLRHDGTNWVANSTLFNNGTNVGIGTVGPLSQLHTAGTLTIGAGATAGSVGNVQITTGGASPVSNRLTYGTDGTGWKFTIGKNQGGTITEQLTIQDNGNVGIGTVSPRFKLELNGKLIGTAAYDANTNLGSYDVGVGSIGAGSSVYSYGPICAGNGFGNCLGTGGVTISPAATLGTPAVAISGSGNSYFNAGNVGIGTPGPGRRLDIVDSAANFPLRVSSSHTGIGSGISLDAAVSGGGGRNWDLVAVGSANGDVSGGGQFAIRDSTVSGASGYRFLINTSGNVGIGTASPGAKLDVAGSIKIVDGSQAAGRVLTSNATGLATWTTLTGTLPPGTSGQTLRHDGTNWVANSTLFNNGTNVGIGTVSPGAKLDVNGEIRTLAGGSGYFGIGSVSPASNDLDFNRPSLAGNLVQRINYHTGISLSAHSAYGGIRFYNQGYDGAIPNPYDNAIGGQMVMAINGGNVGIGTPAPTNPLTVIATNNVEGPPIPRVIAAGDPSAPTKTISIGYDITADAGVLASVHGGTAWKNTLINPTGGNVGIGTASPGFKLDVQNGPIRAGGGLIIEVRTSGSPGGGCNPTTPETGRLWLRTTGCP